jgi:soluble lytic murein transglycosylase-like protein
MWFVWILFAGAGLAQTAAPPKIAAKPAATPPKNAQKGSPAPPRSADKAVAPPPRADQAPAARPAQTFQSSIEKQRAAIAIQREAVRKQSEMAAQWHAATPLHVGPAADCDPIAEVVLTPLIDGAAQQHQVDTKLLRGVIEQESAFLPCAISERGAMGLMQLMPDTAEQFKVADVFDPRQNIEAGATFLRQLLEKYKGDLKLVLAAYNAGPDTVDKAGGIPDIKETQDYVEAILKKLR